MVDFLGFDVGSEDLKRWISKALNLEWYPSSLQEHVSSEV